MSGRRRPQQETAPDAFAFWSQPAEALLTQLDASEGGLSTEQAAKRLDIHGRNTLRERRLSWLGVLVNQVKSPLVLLLVFAAAASAATGEWVDATIVIVTVLASIAVGFSREYDAENAAAALRARVQTRANVLRGGKSCQIPMAEVVPGDVVLLSAGSLVPADGVLLEATDLHVSEAVLTGESFPVRKSLEVSAANAPLAARRNCVFMGTNVRSGAAKALIVATGGKTQVGGIAARLNLRPPPTEFDRGMARFGYLLTTAMVLMVLLVFIVHVAHGRPAIETLLFAIALAVGLSPELLPAVLSVNLARGGQQMAEQGVLVRHLNAIENLGSMDVLCTDKTGTLTEGVVRLEGAYDTAGARSDAVLELAACNAALNRGLANPLDDAILEAAGGRGVEPRKLAEIPFDFTRKRVSVVVATEECALLITKGAFHRVLEVCSSLDDGTVLDAPVRTALEARYERWSEQGIRVIAVASRRLPAEPSYGRESEDQLALAGFLTFLDKPKAGVPEALEALSGLGVQVRLITGDSGSVAKHLAELVGMPNARVLSGAAMNELTADALFQAVEQTDLFVEVDPNQKERIILALKQQGHVVGFLGDGVNDAPAMHAADTSLSVDDAVQVAREAADFVLLERNLDVIRRGIVEGRRTFANTLKYVLMGMSANVGNMISMAVASLWLPFLPLLPGQILINNFLSDIPALGLATDGVDPELVDRPRRWDLRFIGRFTLEFGLISSVFDFLTFGVLLTLHARPELFRSGWFLESVLTQVLVALLIRTRRPFFASKPGKFLRTATLVIVGVAVSLPYLPFADRLGFARVPWTTVLSLVGITLLYCVAVELNKVRFYRRPEPQRGQPWAGGSARRNCCAGNRLGAAS
ncbi:MAG TPA: magnesium-translocating P-type ATPase [Polyangiaceae bacterium]|nr:magnesium-translocating P-type ATPase [Polyangiaceae bacterium]